MTALKISKIQDKITLMKKIDLFQFAVTANMMFTT